MDALTRRNNLSVLFYIKRQKLLKNGEAPICMRITVNGSYVEIMIKRSILVSQWSQSREGSKSKDRNAAELNYYINSIRSRIMQIHQELNIDGKIVTAAAIRDRFNGKDGNTRTLLELHKEHNEKCRALIGREYVAQTVTRFDISRNRLEEFLWSRYNMKDIALNEIKADFIQEYEFWLKTTKQCQNNTMVKYLKILKKVIRIALSNEWIKKDPFLGIKFRYDEVDIEFLSREELDILMNKNFSVKRLEHVRDVFVFCCLTGLAFSDVEQLSAEHLVRDNNGSLWIRKARQKTKQMCNIPVISRAKAILDKYADCEECQIKGRLLPVSSNQKMNAYLKEIADICGIHKRLTTHVARHTAATVVFLANEVSMENVAKILGHSNIKMTQHYAKVLDSSIMRDMGNVERSFANCI